VAFENVQVSEVAQDLTTNQVQDGVCRREMPQSQAVLLSGVLVDVNQTPSLPLPVSQAPAEADVYKAKRGKKR